ncbi:thiamine ABC transporter ATP-binding protein [Kiloniella spongiae]|uniref:Thiamine ABC transporter ATP-binding protein n=1 Tax=Kiloniella spongiae TaxID=1489064 RepID=A0A0H2MFK4_9PROT|nr:thiamine ABC transporter ATP-binding protein [Kiloniella spongiae]KLN60981.1 thiamine ABC transporter ATP-binding protein [Kiloniella spongiae]
MPDDQEAPTPKENHQASFQGLSIEKLSYQHHGSEEVLDFDLRVEPNELVAILGPSGIGKSTLLSLIAGFENSISGAIKFEGKELNNLSPSERPITSLFQEHNLFAHLSAEENIGLGIHPGLRLTSQDKAQITQALNDVGLTGLEKRLPAELSGGQRQRVALARCLVRRRPILLLDEPFSALDQDLRKEMLKLVKDLHQNHGLLTLMVTHLKEDADAIADRIVHLT